MEKKKVAIAVLASYALLLGYTFAMGMMGGYGGYGGMMGGYGVAPGYAWGDDYTQTSKRGFIDRFLGGFLGGGFAGYGMGAGMMGGAGYGGMMGGYGMPGGYSGVMGGCGGFWGVPANGEEITREQAEEALTSYLSYIGDPNLGIREIMEFQYNYYAIVEEKDTGKAAFELLVDKRTGVVTPEPGPNMMWNLKYGHHSFGYVTENKITEEEAVKIAQRYLDVFAPGWKADDHADEFYGYYTLHTLDENGNITGMLSVNGFTGEVWFHSWHGEYEGEGHEE